MSAIRSGWREGYNAEADHFIVSGADSDEIARSFEHVKEAIRQAAGYTKFTTDTSRLFELRAERVSSADEHPRHRGIDLGTVGEILCLQVNAKNHRPSLPNLKLVVE